MWLMCSCRCTADQQTILGFLYLRLLTDERVRIFARADRCGLCVPRCVLFGLPLHCWLTPRCSFPSRSCSTNTILGIIEGIYAWPTTDGTTLILAWRAFCERQRRVYYFFRAREWLVLSGRNCWSFRIRPYPILCTASHSELRS
jgi:hypothetical protein